MRTVIFGAGAIGGWLGGILTAAGEDVTLVARGAQYEALSTRGMKIDGPRTGRPEPIKVKVCRPGEEKGPFDLVFVGLKSQQIESAAEHIKALAGRDGAILMPQNGIPWWYFDGIDSPLRGTRLSTLDPNGVLAKAFDPAQIIGGISFKPTDQYAPACVRVADAAEDKLSIGEVDNRMTSRLNEIAAMVDRAGWKGLVTDDIRKVKWTKLLSNAVWNPLGVITQSTATELAGYAPTRDLAMAMLSEVMAVSASVGVKLDGDPAAICESVAKRASVPSSTMQDVRTGKMLELDAILNSVIEIGGLTGVAMPNLKIVAACANVVNQRIVNDGVQFAPVKIAAK